MSLGVSREEEGGYGGMKGRMGSYCEGGRHFSIVRLGRRWRNGDKGGTEIEAHRSLFLPSQALSRSALPPANSEWGRAGSWSRRGSCRRRVVLLLCLCPTQRRQRVR